MCKSINSLDNYYHKILIIKFRKKLANPREKL